MLSCRPHRRPGALASVLVVILCGLLSSCSIHRADPGDSRSSPAVISSTEAQTPSGSLETRSAIDRRSVAQPELLCSLTRSRCMGRCPAYSVEVMDDGTVTYRGKSGVRTAGEQRATLGDAELKELVSVFTDARFFQLMDAYTYHDTTDFPSVTVALSRDGRVKKVRHYLGDFLAPPSLERLEWRIDKMLNTSQWVGDKPGGVAGTTRMESRPKVGVLANAATDAKEVLVTLIENTSVLSGAVLIVSTEEAYTGRLRVKSIASGTCACVVEDIEPGSALLAGQLVWASPPPAPELAPTSDPAEQFDEALADHDGITQVGRVTEVTDKVLVAERQPEGAASRDGRPRYLKSVRVGDRFDVISGSDYAGRIKVIALLSSESFRCEVIVASPRGVKVGDVIVSGL
jgi:Domain of unknown function (DUF6438)